MVADSSGPRNYLRKKQSHSANPYGGVKKYLERTWDTADPKLPSAFKKIKDGAINPLTEAISKAGIHSINTQWFVSA